MNVSPTEILIATIARLLAGCRNVVIGNASPIPGSAALLARELAGGALRLTILGSAQAHRLHRRRRRDVRPRRAGAGRRVLPRRRADRRRGEHQPRRGGRISAERRPLARLVRLGVSLLHGAEGDPLPRGAHPAGVRAQGGLRLGARHEPGRGVPPGRAVEASHRPRALRVRPGAQAVHARERPSRAHGRGDRRQHRLRLRPAGGCRRRLRPIRDARAHPRRVRDEIAETYPKFAAQVLGHAA